MVVDRSNSPWIPSFFVDFERELCGSALGEEKAREHSVRLIENGHKRKVDRLTMAASKWRVANSINGLKASILPPKAKRQSCDVPENQISKGLLDSYTAQFSIALGVFAFEAYAKCFGCQGRDWYQHKQRVFSTSNSELSSRLRNVPGASELSAQISGFLDNENQKRRVDDFFQGSEDNNLYDICQFIRHGYAHGALRGFEGLIAIAPDLKGYILEGIRNHVVAITEECRSN